MVPGTRKLYVYERPGFRLVVYRDRIVLREWLYLTPRTVVFPLADFAAVRCQGGRLFLEFLDGSELDYDLGPAARDVCDLMVGLL